MLIFSACGNNSRQSEPVFNDGQTEPEVLQSDTCSVKLDVEGTKDDEKPSVQTSSFSSSTRKSSNYDNMRGFDPASEDDMDDNGMSRYMENNDEEGWD